MDEINQINDSDVLEKNEIKPKVNKTADYKAYMREWMKKHYTSNPVEHRRYRNSLNVRKRYVITPEIWEKYGSNLYSVVTLKEIIDEMPEGSFEKFLMEYKSLQFEKIEKDK